MVFTRRGHMAIGVIVVCYLFSLLPWLIFDSLYRPAKPWGSYVTVVTGLPNVEAERLLHEAGVTNTISEHTTYVTVSRFSSLRTEELSSLLSRLDPLDPRRDPYIGGLMRYFRLTDDNGEWSLLYAVMDGSLWRAQRLVRKTLGSASRIAEWHPGQTLLACALFLGLAAIVIGACIVARFGARRRNMALLLLGIPPWIPTIFAFGIPGAVVATVVFFVWVWGTEDLFTKPTIEMSRIAVMATVALLASIYGASFGGFSALLPMAVAILGTSSATAGIVLIAKTSRRVRDHRLFTPVAILPGMLRISVNRSTFLLLPMLLASCLVLPLLAVRIVPGTRIAAPRPTDLGRDGDLSWESLNALWMTDVGSDLPNLSDFVAHSAYQEALVFGGDYRFPSENETISISRFSQVSDGAYEQFDEVMLVHDQKWLSNVVESAPPGPAVMLRALGRPTGVVVFPERSLYSGHLQLLQHIVFVLLVFAPFMLGGLRWSVAGSGTRVLEIMRRRRQVA